MLTREMFNQPYLEIEPYKAEERLMECIDFINTKRPDLEENFKRNFFVEHWKTRDTKYPTKTRIMCDFAPLSFYFEKVVMIDGEWKRDYNGGIIFHGSHDGGGDGGAPTFSVSLTPVDGWATHT
jgi:hypothetical protein